MVLMCKSSGKSSITESIFENRFMHVAELQRLGAKINVMNNKAIIEGNTKFIGGFDNIFEMLSKPKVNTLNVRTNAADPSADEIINAVEHVNGNQFNNFQSNFSIDPRELPDADSWTMTLIKPDGTSVEQSINDTDTSLNISNAIAAKL